MKDDLGTSFFVLRLSAGRTKTSTTKYKVQSAKYREKIELDNFQTTEEVSDLDRGVFVRIRTVRRILAN